jgi:hypothetical protein
VEQRLRRGSGAMLTIELFVLWDWEEQAITPLEKKSKPVF